MKITIITYAIALHLVVLFLVLKTDFLERASKFVQRRVSDGKNLEAFGEWHHRSVLLHSRAIGSVPDESVLFFGDSLTQGLCVSAVSPLGVNFGIASDTTEGLVSRLPAYEDALQRCQCVVVAVGINDGAYRTVSEAMDKYGQILMQLPGSSKVFICALLPVDDRTEKITADRVAWVADFNAELRKLADKHSQVTFLDHTKVLDTNGDGRLDAKHHLGDGIHLSTEGNLAWAAALRADLATTLE